MNLFIKMMGPSKETFHSTFIYPGDRLCLFQSVICQLLPLVTNFCEHCSGSADAALMQCWQNGNNSICNKFDFVVLRISQLQTNSISPIQENYYLWFTQYDVTLQPCGALSDISRTQLMRPSCNWVKHSRWVNPAQMFCWFCYKFHTVQKS